MGIENLENLELTSDPKISAISPLEGAISGLLERVRQIALKMDAKKLREAHQDYEHRRSDLQEFLADLENNPLEFPMDEIEELEQSAVLLDQQLDITGLYLDMIVHSPQLVAESIDIYLKDTSVIPNNVIEDELSKIKNSALRESILKNNENQTEKYLQHYSLAEIRKTINLLNQYFEENSENERYYKNLLYFLHDNKAAWIPVGKEIYSGVFLNEKQETSVSQKNNARLKQIERKIAAFELEVVPEKKKPERLREIQGLKTELSKMENNSSEVIILQAKLENLYRVLIPRPAGMGFFGGLRPGNLMTA